LANKLIDLIEEECQICLFIHDEEWLKLRDPTITRRLDVDHKIAIFKDFLEILGVDIQKVEFQRASDAERRLMGIPEKKELIDDISTKTNMAEAIKKMESMSVVSFGKRVSHADFQEVFIEILSTVLLDYDVDLVLLGEPRVPIYNYLKSVIELFMPMINVPPLLPLKRIPLFRVPGQHLPHYRDNLLSLKKKLSSITQTDKKYIPNLFRGVIHPYSRRIKGQEVLKINGSRLEETTNINDVSIDDREALVLSNFIEIFEHIKTQMDKKRRFFKPISERNVADKETLRVFELLKTENVVRILSYVVHMHVQGRTETECTQKAIAENTGIDKATVNRMLKKMIDKNVQLVLKNKKKRDSAFHYAPTAISLSLKLDFRRIPWKSTEAGGSI